MPAAHALVCSQGAHFVHLRRVQGMLNTMYGSGSGSRAQQQVGSAGTDSIQHQTILEQMVRPAGLQTGRGTLSGTSLPVWQVMHPVGSRIPPYLGHG
jgi:hypothetical protein